jgi:Helix-turn-helix domain
MQEPGDLKHERKPETLHRQVSRMKARWLQRVMYSTAIPSAKVFGFVIFDCLNCVTLDAWPAQRTFAERMRCSTKTVQRSADGLEDLGFVRVARSRLRDVNHRYAPVFLSEDSNAAVHSGGRGRLRTVDLDVHESSSSIHLESFPSRSREQSDRLKRISNYRRAERGRWERELIRALGSNGSETLERLSRIDDAIVDRLCRGFCDGLIGEREIEAARLAAYQLPGTRRIW